MNRPKLVVFDCDGVMFDSLEANRRYYNDLLAHFGRPEMDPEELEYVHIHNVMDSVAHIFRHYPVEEVAAANRFRLENEYTPYLKYMIMAPDLIEFLEYLRPEIHTAISTNRTTTMPEIMRMHALEPLFDKVVTAFDVERPKPDPMALEVILGSFGLSVEEAVYIGDTMVDREHTAAIGMRLIAFKNPALPAEFHVNSFTAVRSLPIFG